MKHLVRRHKMDVLIVATAAGVFVDGLLRSRPIAAAAGPVLILPLLLRRRAPFAPLAWLWLGAAGLSFADGGLVASSAGIYAAGLIGAFLIGSLRDERQGRIGLAIVLGSAAIIALNDPERSVSEILLVPAWFTLAWLGGLGMRQRAVQADRAEERAVQAEREREEAARVAVAAERSRIARELHDVVSHSISVMGIQAGAARRQLPPGTDEVRGVLLSVEETGRQALAEMRRLLGVLRSEHGPLALSPQPGIGDLSELVAGARDAGQPVELRIDVDGGAVAPGVQLAAYRIVQEALTNVRKHASAAPATVSVRRRGGVLELEIRDSGPGAAGDGGGFGLVGMRERVAIYGGRLEISSPAGGGHVVRARLPLEGTAP